MHTFVFNITREDVDAHIRASLSEEDREKFKNMKFVPFSVRYNEDMNIEVKAVAAYDVAKEEE